MTTEETNSSTSSTSTSSSTADTTTQSLITSTIHTSTGEIMGNTTEALNASTTTTSTQTSIGEITGKTTQPPSGLQLWHYYLIGGVIGGSILIIFLIVLITCCVCRKRRKREADELAKVANGIPDDQQTQKQEQKMQTNKEETKQANQTGPSPHQQQNPAKIQAKNTSSPLSTRVADQKKEKNRRSQFSVGEGDLSQASDQSFKTQEVYQLKRQPKRQLITPPAQMSIGAASTTKAAIPIVAKSTVVAKSPMIADSMASESMATCLVRTGCSVPMASVSPKANMPVVVQNAKQPNTSPKDGIVASSYVSIKKSQSPNPATNAAAASAVTAQIPPKSQLPSMK